MSNPASATPPSDSTELERLYGSRWLIRLEHSLGVWSAEHRSADGRHIRVIVAHSAAELAGKLETAEVVEP